MKGKLIIIEGTDCSGKETQSKLLCDKLTKEGYKVFMTGFPMYDTPTGKIIGGPYLGKPAICEGWFSEGAINVDPKVASLYYAADRKYNIGKITEKLKEGINVILDRYTYSNLAHQGGKLESKKERDEMYEWFDKLEFGLLGLPHADIKIFLHMPYEAACILKEGREEPADQHEASESHLKASERAYLEVADKYDFKIIECSKKPIIRENIRTIEDINDELTNYVISLL